MASKLNLLQLRTLISCYKTLREAQEKINRLTLQVDDEDLHALSKYIATDVGYARGCMRARGENEE